MVFDENDRRPKTKLILETSQSFASFVYDLSVEEKRGGNHIHLKVLGLKPPQLSMQSAGHAKFERVYDSLAGKCEVTIEGIDGSTNTFILRVSTKKNKIELLQSPRDRFTELILDDLQTSTH